MAIIQIRSDVYCIYADVKFRMCRLMKRIRSHYQKHPFHSAMTFLVVTPLLLFFAIPKNGKILPVDPHMVQAYSVLGKTKTGKQLIRRVKKSTAGSYIYLSLGSTEKDQLVDFYGNTVRGVTRATYHSGNRMMYPKSVTVITNRDLVGMAPRDIIRSLAFELENVEYSFRNPPIDFHGDSPRAEYTQQLIMEELDL